MRKELMFLMVLVLGMTACEMGGGDDINVNPKPPSNPDGGLPALALVELTEMPISGVRWGKRSDFQAVVFDNYLYVIGGENFGQRFNDIWRTHDGENWEDVSPSSGSHWSPRSDFQAVVFDNYLYVIGGEVAANNRFILSEEIWRTSDGENWEKVIPQGVSFPGMSDFQAGVRSDELYLIDFTASGAVWLTKDGVSWTKEIYQLPAGADARRGQAVVEKNNALLILGNNFSSKEVMHIYRQDAPDYNFSNQSVSYTGANWQGRRGHQAVKIQENIFYVMGGKKLGSQSVGINGQGHYFHDIWKLNTTGKNHSITRLGPNIGATHWGARSLFQAVVFGDHLYVMGGIFIASGTSSVNYFDDVWRLKTENPSEEWEEVKMVNGVYGIAAVEQTLYLLKQAGPKLVVLAKDHNSDNFQEISSTTSRIKTSDGQVPRRVGAGVFARDDKVYMMGGVLLPGHAPGGMRRITSQSDELLWASGGFVFDPDSSTFTAKDFGSEEPKIKDYEAEVLGEYVYLLGGQGEGNQSVSYRSKNLSQWESLTEVDELAISGFATLVHGDTILLLGGKNADQEAVNTVYSLSADGKITPVSVQTPFPARYLATGFAYQDRIFLVGGITTTNGTEEVLERIWQSTDGGQNWEQMSDEIKIKSYGHHTVVGDGVFYTLGGSSDVNLSPGGEGVSVYYKAVFNN